MRKIKIYVRTLWGGPVKTSIRNFLKTIAFLYATQASAGHFTGNGGDHVRGMFLKLGEAVVAFLNETEEGKKLLVDNNLNVESIKKTLSIEVVFAIETPLIDNGGSSVDAIGEKGKILLNKNRWTEHLEKERDVYYLVLHEILRVLEVNDDNYIISKAIMPFPVSRRIHTKITPLYPLILSERLDKVFKLDQISVNGTGCPLQSLGTRVDFDKESNQLDISFEEYLLNLTKENNDVVSRKNCALSIPIQLPKNTRLIVTQMDLGANLELSKNSQLNFGAEVFFAGETNQKFTQIVTGKDQPEKGRSLLRRNQILKSACGGEGNFRTNTFAELSRKLMTENSKAALANFKLSFKLENCVLNK